MSSASNMDADSPESHIDDSPAVLAATSAAHLKGGTASELSLHPNDIQVQAESLSTDDDAAPADSWLRRRASGARRFLVSYHFPLLIVLSIAAARVYPPLGAEYLHPNITATWIAIVIMFFLSGLGLRIAQFAEVVQLFSFNVTVELYNFILVSAVMFGASRVLLHVHALDEKLADGMVICGCLPVAINAVIVLAVASGGHEAAAIFHAAVGNILGIFLSPVLISMYLGKTGHVSLRDVMLSLTYRVILPLVAGQLAQLLSMRVQTFADTHKRASKLTQEGCLIYIVYTVFCRTFESDTKAGIGDIFIMIASLLVLMVGLFFWAWILLQRLFPDEPELRITGLFTCVQKTIALGVPLIASMYEDDPAIGLYTLPILIWHPMQLVVGSLMIPSLVSFGEKEKVRLEHLSDNNDNAISVDEEIEPVVEGKINDEIVASPPMDDTVSRGRSDDENASSPTDCQEVPL